MFTFTVYPVYLYILHLEKAAVVTGRGRRSRKHKRQTYLLRRRANARNVSFRISLRWLTYIVNSVDKTKLSHRKQYGGQNEPRAFIVFIP